MGRGHIFQTSICGPILHPEQGYHIQFPSGYVQGLGQKKTKKKQKARDQGNVCVRALRCQTDDQPINNAEDILEKAYVPNIMSSLLLY